MNKAQQGIARSFARAASSYDRHALVQNQIAQHLAAYLPQGAEYDHILEFGCGTGLLTKALKGRINAQHWLLNDLSSAITEKAEQYLEQQTYTKLIGDISEVLSQITTPLDLIASASALQWIEDPFLLLTKAKNSLPPKGLCSSLHLENVIYTSCAPSRGEGSTIFPHRRIGSFAHETSKM